MSIINFIYFVSLCVYLIFGYERRRIQNIQLNVKRDKQENNIYISTEHHIVYPFEPLCITIQNFNIDYIECRSYHTSYKYNCTITNHDAMRSEIQISSVTYGMSDMWVCTFRGFSGNTLIYFEIEVVGAKPPQSVIINNVLLPVEKYHGRYITEYYYEEGDIVDIKCIAQKEKYCSLMYYSSMLPRKNIPTFSVQDRRKLKAIHSNTYIVCTSICYNMNTTSLLVTFILGVPKKRATLKIGNNQIVSTAIGYQPSVYYRTFYVNYAYFMFGNLSIVCDMFGEGYLSFGCVSCDLKDRSDELKLMTILVIPKAISRIEFTVRNERNTFEKSVVTFTSIADNEYDMKVWDGFQYPAETTTPPKVHPVSKTTSKDIAARHRQAMYSSTTTSITTISSIPTTVPTEIEEQWAPVVISLIIIIVLIIISTVMYKLRKHMLNKRQAYKNCEESLNDNGSSIAPYPAQWNSEATYTNIDGFTNDIRNTDDKIPELDNVYATPDIKYETLVNPKNTDYQNIAMFNNTKPVPKDVYAQVVPKSKRERTYANTGRNLSPDYEQTMYAEINSTS